MLMRGEACNVLAIHQNHAIDLRLGARPVGDRVDKR